MQTYPDSPGYKSPTTSKEAAQSVVKTSVLLRVRVLECLKANPLGLTADECCEKLGITVLSGRPRFSELLLRGDIRDTGKTRANQSGRKATVWSYTI